MIFTIWTRFRHLLDARLFTTDGRKVAFYTLAHSLYTLLAGGFEIALILRLTGLIERVVFLNFFVYILLYLAFAGGTLLLRSGKVSRSFRLDLATQAAACLYMLVNFDNLSNSLILAGFFVFKGISEGFFWSTRHSALLHSVGDAQRDGWALKLQTATIVLGIVLPIISGFVISYLVLPATPAAGTAPLPSGYYPVYALTGCLALLALLVSPRLRIPAQTVSFRKTMALRKVKHSRDWIAYSACGTVSSVTVLMAVGILNFHVLKTEFNMGLFASWIALASAVFFWLVNLARRRLSLPRLGMVLAGDLGDIASKTLYAFCLNLPTLIGKSLLDSFIVPLRGVFGENILRRRAELMAHHNGLSIAEAILFQETVLLVARAITCVGLMVILNLVNASPVPTARLLLFIFMGYGIIDFLFIRRINRGNQTLTEKAGAPPR